MQSIYLPVRSGNFRTIIKLAKLKGWWDKEPIGYPHALMSYVSSKDLRDLPKESYLFGDSGGYTLITRPETTIDPIRVLRWQMATCSVGAILDWPPRMMTIRRFDEYLERTLINVKRALPVYLRALDRGSKFRWWAVVHGNDYEEMARWHAAVSEVYPFTADGEGWCIKTGYGGAGTRHIAIAMAEATRALVQLGGVRRAHYLACTDQRGVPVVEYFARKAGFEFISYDSASVAIGTANRHVFIRTDEYLHRGKIFHDNVERARERHLRDFLLTECACKGCAHMRSVIDLDAPEVHDIKYQGRPWQYWFYLHNTVTHTGAMLELQQAAAVDAEALFRKMMPEDEVETAIRVFKGELPARTGRTTTDKSLLDFA
jgi:hypothetical protein